MASANSSMRKMPDLRPEEKRTFRFGDRASAGPEPGDGQAL